MTVTVFMAVLFTSSLFVILKLFDRFKISNIHGLTFNYFTAGFCFTVYSKQTFSSISGFAASYFPYFFLSGSLFIGVFYLTALSSQKNGVASTTIASKMSLVIPTLLAVYLYDETFSIQKTTGLLMALAAVYLSARGATINHQCQDGHYLYWYLQVQAWLMLQSNIHNMFLPTMKVETATSH